VADPPLPPGYTEGGAGAGEGAPPLPPGYTEVGAAPAGGASGEAKDTGWTGAAKGVADVALSVGSGIAQQAVGVPKHLAQLAGKVTEPLSRMTPEQRKLAAAHDAEPGLTEKLQGLLSHQPTSEEGKYLLGKIQDLLEPVTRAGQAVHEGIASVAGEEAANVAGDVAGLAGVKGAGTASKTAKILKTAESTQSKVQRLTENLSGGKSLEKADVAGAATKAITATTQEAKKAGTTAYDELSKVMGPGTPINLTESTKVAQHHGAGIVVDPKVKAVADKLQSVGQMTFDSLKEFRTQISDLMGTDRNVNRKLRALRDAVTKDIDKAAENLSPEAKKKWDVANQKWKEYVKAEDEINRVLGKNWGAKTSAEMYQKMLLAAMKDPQKVVTVMKTIRDPAVQKQFAASVLHHMSDKGGEFDGDKLVRNWDSMNPQARRALFPPDYEANMTKLVHNLKRIKEGHSGLIKEVSGVGVAAILGHFLPGGTAVVGAVTLGREAYKFGPKAIESYLTSPEWVRKLAERTTAALKKTSSAAVIGTQQTQPRTLKDEQGYGQRE